MKVNKFYKNLKKTDIIAEIGVKIHVVNRLSLAKRLKVKEAKIAGADAVKISNLFSRLTCFTWNARKGQVSKKLSR